VVNKTVSKLKKLNWNDRNKTSTDVYIFLNEETDRLWLHACDHKSFLKSRRLYRLQYSLGMASKKKQIAYDVRKEHCAGEYDEVIGNV